MFSRTLFAAVGVCAMAGAAPAAITFTFDDPSADRETRYSRNDVGLGGELSYSPDVMVDLVVDATQEGAAMPWVYESRLTIEIDVDAATLPGVPIAETTGTFFFEILDDTRGVSGTFVEILRGTFNVGTLFAADTAGAVLSSSLGGMTYEASNDLADELTNIGITDLANDFSVFDAAFTLTNITPGASLDETNSFRDFTADTAYTGTATVPAPGVAALAIAAGGLGATRRRRC